MEEILKQLRAGNKKHATAKLLPTVVQSVHAQVMSDSISLSTSPLI